MFVHRSVLPLENFLFRFVVVDIDSVVVRPDDEHIESKFNLRNPLLGMFEHLKHGHLVCFFFKPKDTHSSLLAPHDYELFIRGNADAPAF